MDPVRKALWFVESHYRETITLDDIARACEVSPFHLTRAFASSTGLSLMRYVRARRLSQAARTLVNGARDILTVALDAGYGSHEAFTRAFKDLFALTPEQLRSRGHLGEIPIVEAITMETKSHPDLSVRFETLRPKLFAGTVERYDCQAPAGIPDQWQRFSPYLGNISGQTGEAAYGICYNFDGDDNFDYMCAVEVNDASDLPKEFKTLRVDAREYAVFRHAGHIAAIRDTFRAIWSDWFVQSGCQTVPAPTFERYGPGFDPRTGLGGVEIWIAVKRTKR